MSDFPMSGAALVITLWIAVASAPAQSITMPDGSKPPRRFVKDDQGQPHRVWAAYQGYVPKARPAADSVSLPGAKPLKFMESCFYASVWQGPSAAGTKAEDATYFLLAKPAPDGDSAASLLGWVKSAYVVTRPEAVRDEATRIYRKIFFATTARERKVEDRFVVRVAPNAQAELAESIQPVTLSFKYGEADGHVLVGLAQSFDASALAQGETPGDVVRGWVPKEFTIGWNTREAVAWDRPSTLAPAQTRRTTPGRIYRSAADAARALRNPSDVVACILEERRDPKGQAVEFAPYSLRFPIIDWGDEEASGIRNALGNKLLKVVVIGESPGPDGAGASAQEAAQIRRKLQRIRDEVLGVEQILFVIDDTASMRPVFPFVAETVRMIVEDAGRDRSRHVQVAVSYYNDRVNGQPGYRTMPLKDAATNGTAILRELRDHVFMVGGDPREMVFEGISRAIDAAGFEFEPQARKLVVVIGDSPDHSDEHEAGHPAEARVVAKLLRSGQAPIEFFAVRFRQADGGGDKIAFETQMRTIVGLLNDRGREFGRALGTLVTLPDANLTGVLNQRYEELRREGRALQDELMRLTAGSSSQISFDLTRVLTDHGIDAARLRTWMSVPTCEVGYVWKFAPHPTTGANSVAQVRSYLLLSESEIRDLVQEVDGLFRERSSGGSRSDVRAVIRTLVGRTVGEQSDRWSYYDVILRTRGLEARSPLLMGPVASINPQLARREVPEIRVRVNRLKDILDRKQRTWSAERVIDPESGIEAVEYEGSPSTRRDRFFQLSRSRTNWCWIDFREELP